MASVYKTNKKENIDKTLTMRKSGSGEKVFSHVGGKTHALEKKAISKKEALKQIEKEQFKKKNISSKDAKKFLKDFAKGKK